MAYIDQHAPRPKDDTSEGNLEPNEDEKKLVKQIQRMFEKAAKHRRKYDKDWIDNYKMYRGQQWLGKRPTYKSREVINMIYQTIQSQTSVMLDTRPTVSFLPEEPADLEFAEILNEVYDAERQKYTWLDETAAVIYDAHFYGVGWSETCAKMIRGAYRTEYKSRDPFDFYPDPDASDVNKEGEYLITAKPTDIDKVKKKYAGHPLVSLIKPDIEDLSYEKRQVETLHKRKNIDADLPAEKTSYASSVEDEGKDKVLVITAYLKPSDTEMIEKEDEECAGEKLYITRLKYPRGRKVEMINNRIYADGELEYDDLEFPFERLINSMLPREFFGMSEVEQGKGPQLAFNKLINFALDVLYLTGNPIWLNPTNSGVESRQLINYPGLVVEHAPEGAPTRVEGTQLQPYVFQLIDRMEKWFNDNMGTQDVTRGVNPTGVTANAAIENLLEAAQKRIKQKMRYLDSYLMNHGKHWVSRVMQYYTKPQVFRLTNQEGVNKYFKMYIEQRDTGKVAIVRNFEKNDLGEMVPRADAREYQIRGEFDVRVNTVSGLPFTKAMNEQTAYQLFDRGIIDEEEVLNRLEYPNKEKILIRLREKQKQMAEQQSMQAKGA